MSNILINYISIKMKKHISYIMTLSSLIMILPSAELFSLLSTPSLRLYGLRNQSVSTPYPFHPRIPAIYGSTIIFSEQSFLKLFYM